MSDAEPLLEAGGLRITRSLVTAPGGEYPVADIERVQSRVSRPLWGPVVLALVGTFNLAIAMEAGGALDLLAPAVMFAAAIGWRWFGTRHVLTFRLAGKPTDVWLSRHEADLRRAQEIVEGLVGEGRRR